MALSSPDRSSTASTSAPPPPPPPPRRLSLNSLLSISSLMALCAKHASRVSRKLKPSHSQIDNGSPKNRQKRHVFISSPNYKSSAPSTPKAKHLFTQISNKAITLIHHHKSRNNVDDDLMVGPDEYGDGGVWQKAILMGDKCQPLDFSGVIYYDNRGQQLDELPSRSPRASPLPAYLQTRAM